MGSDYLRESLQPRLSRPGARTGVFLILLVSLMVYLPMLGQLGYYRDDWHVAWAGMLFGPEKIIDLHLTDRPVMGVFYSLAYRVVGDSPLSWQIYSLVLRIAGALVFIWLLRLLWPAQRKATTLMGLFFVLYPGFLQMPTASAYSNHLFGLAIGIFSIVLSIDALKKSGGWLRVLLVGLSVITGLTCYSIMEYMISLEAVRLVLLGYMQVREQPNQRFREFFLPANLFRLVRQWLPTLIGLIIFLTWRVFIFKSARSVTDVGSLARSYLNEPGIMLARFIVETVKGIFNALILAWGVPFYNAVMNARYVDLLASFLMAILVIFVVLVFIRSLKAAQGDAQKVGQVDEAWAMDAVWLGLLIVVINLVPIVLANRNIRLTDTFDRYTLPASLGAVMVIVGLISKLHHRAQTIVVVLLLWVCVFTQYNSTAYFRNFWEYQRQLWWQLSWRAPGFKDGTVLIPTLPSGYGLAESYEVWGPANIIYGTQDAPLTLSGEVLNNDTVLSVVNQQNYTRGVRRVIISLDFKNSLILSLPSSDSCLHVLDGNWQELESDESPLVRLAAPHSRVNLIDPWVEGKTPPAVIFGREPDHGWCYFYQKAGLARQKKDWTELARLGDEVRARGIQPQNVLEWMPFYQGYAYASRLDKADEVAHDIRVDQLALRGFCAQFSQEELAQLRPGSVDEYIIINVCPTDWLIGD